VRVHPCTALHRRRARRLVRWTSYRCGDPRLFLSRNFACTRKQLESRHMCLLWACFRMAWVLGDNVNQLVDNHIGHSTGHNSLAFVDRSFAKFTLENPRNLPSARLTQPRGAVSAVEPVPRSEAQSPRIATRTTSKNSVPSGTCFCCAMTTGRPTIFDRRIRPRALTTVCQKLSETGRENSNTNPVVEEEGTAVTDEATVAVAKIREKKSMSKCRTAPRRCRECLRIREQ
jgi:hypothetical protein